MYIWTPEELDKIHHWHNALEIWIRAIRVDPENVKMTKAVQVILTQESKDLTLRKIA